MAAHADEPLSSGYFDIPWEVKDNLTCFAGLLHLPSAGTRHWNPIDLVSPRISIRKVGALRVPPETPIDGDGE